MTTLIVKSLENDFSNTDTLVYAISQANAGGADSIAFDSSLNGETFDFSTLTSLNGTAEEQLFAINVVSGTLANLTGTVTATASGEAAGALSRLAGGSQALNVSSSTGTVTAESTGGTAYGLAVDSPNVVGGGESRALLTFDTMALDVTVTAADDAYGLFARASRSNYYYYETTASATASMGLGDLTGQVRVTGAKAYGLYLSAEKAYSRTATLTVGDVTGTITATATDGDACGMYSSQTLTAGDLSAGSITVEATANAYGMYSGQTLTAGD